MKISVYVILLLTLIIPLSGTSEQQYKKRASITLINKTDHAIELKTRFNYEEIFYGLLGPQQMFDITASRHYTDDPRFQVFVQYKNSGYGWQDINLAEIKQQVRNPDIRINIKPFSILGISAGLLIEIETGQAKA